MSRLLSAISEAWFYERATMRMTDPLVDVTLEMDKHVPVQREVSEVEWMLALATLKEAVRLYDLDALEGHHIDCQTWAAMAREVIQRIEGQ